MVSVHVLKVRYGGAELCGAPLVQCVDDQDSSVSLFVVAQQGVAVDPGLLLLRVSSWSGRRSSTGAVQADCSSITGP